MIFNQSLAIDAAWLFDMLLVAFLRRETSFEELIIINDI